MHEMTQRLTIELRRLARDSHEQCSLCSRPFNEGDTSHLGYDREGAPLYVGDCCASELAETAVRQYFMPRDYEVPPGESSIWRYMDLAKLIALFSDQALHFARCDQLDDPFEGAIGSTERKHIWDDHYRKFFEQAIRNPPEGFEFKLSDAELAELAEQVERAMDNFGRSSGRHLQRCYVSCWHENLGESEALWQLYGRDMQRAVAVRTTVDSLNQALSDDPWIQIGRVSYIDYRRRFAKVQAPYFFKRLSFQHEKEIRAVHRDHDTSSPLPWGISLPVDVSVLVEAVHITPQAPAWYAGVVADVLGKYGYSGPVNKSDLLDTPFH